MCMYHYVSLYIASTCQHQSYCNDAIVVYKARVNIIFPVSLEDIDREMRERACQNIEACSVLGCTMMTGCLLGRSLG